MVSLYGSWPISTYNIGRYRSALIFKVKSRLGLISNSKGADGAAGVNSQSMKGEHLHFYIHSSLMQWFLVPAFSHYTVIKILWGWGNNGKQIIIQIAFYEIKMQLLSTTKRKYRLSIYFTFTYSSPVGRTACLVKCFFFNLCQVSLVILEWKLRPSTGQYGQKPITN